MRLYARNLVKIETAYLFLNFGLLAKGEGGLQLPYLTFLVAPLTYPYCIFVVRLR